MKINYAEPDIGEAEIASVTESLRNGDLSLGRKGEEFCSRFSKYLGVNSTILTNSGSSANWLAIAALKDLYGIQDVILPGVIFPTTLSAVIQNQLRPIVLDVDLGSYNISLDQIEKVLPFTDKTLIIAQHTLGSPINMPKLFDLAQNYSALILEDNCDSLGSELNGQKTGSFGTVSTCSFYPAHLITMGEGGAISIKSPNYDLHRKIVSLRDWGRSCYCTRDSGQNGACGMRFEHNVDGIKYDHRYIYSNIGMSLRPSEIQAVIGLAQIAKIEKYTVLRRRNFNYLYDKLKQFDEYFILPKVLENANPCFFAFPLTLTKKFPASRENFVKFLEHENIQTRMLLSGNVTRQPVFNHLRKDLPNSDYVMKNSFFIGSHPNLEISQLDYIIDKFTEFLEK